MMITTWRSTRRTIVIAVLAGIFMSTGMGGCAPIHKPSEVEVTQEAIPTATSVSPTPGTVYEEEPMLTKLVDACELRQKISELETSEKVRMRAEDDLRWMMIKR